MWCVIDASGAIARRDRRPPHIRRSVQTTIAHSIAPATSAAARHALAGRRSAGGQVVAGRRAGYCHTALMIPQYSGMPMLMLNGNVTLSESNSKSPGLASGIAWRIAAGAAM